MTAPDVTAPDVIAPDRGAITSGRRIQVLSVRETHCPQAHKGPGDFHSRALSGLGSSS
jgi:hypothetical protein